MTLPLHLRSASDWLGMLARGETTSCELVELCLSRMEQLNPRLNAIVALDAKSAREQAQRADLARAHNADSGPLHGLPMTIKDTLEVAGFACTSGAEKYRNYRPVRHAPAVQRLVDAGAIILGKTNVPQFGGDIQTDNLLFGATQTPWREGHNAGGSSGGAAAAVAAGLVPLELGTDLAGSLRIPAHCCGVTSHRPTTGLVSVVGQLAGTPGRLAPMDMLAVGPLARDPADLALALEVLLAPGKAAQLSRPRGAVDLAKLRLACWFDDVDCPPDASVAAVLAGAAETLAAAGARLQSLTPVADPSGMFESFLRLMYAAMSVEWPDSLITRLTDSAAALPPDSRGLPGAMALGATMSHRSWLQQHEVRLQLAEQVEALLADYDALLCPVLHRTAWPHETTALARRTVRLGGRDWPWMQQCFWIALPTLLGLPATVIPAGLDSDGLPVGLQLIGARNGDFRLLQVAARLHKVLGCMF
ncbi:MAG: hypothetical protein JJU27_17645 [Gammaproteobacteria bacterium]|nr:hypothetical protein [Gammaproteobacteria bacterium]